MGYAAISQRANNPIARKGAPVTFTRNTQTVDTATGEPSGAGPSSATTVAIGVKSNWEQFAALGLTLNIPVTIKASGYGMTFIPQPGDSFVWGGFAYSVVTAERLEPDGTPILHTVVGNR